MNATARCRVLVIDDDTDVRESTAMVIRLLGHDVFTAPDGKSGVEAVRTFLPELVLLDVGLPDADGYDVARWIRAEQTGRHTLLAAMTGWVGDDDRSAADDAGFDLHLPKPVDLQTLRALIARAASGGGNHDAPISTSA